MELKRRGYPELGEMQPGVHLSSGAVGSGGAAVQDWEVTLVDDGFQAGSLAAEWDDLLKRSDFNDVFSSPGFARAWWRAFGGSKGLSVFFLRDADAKLRLVAPLYFEAGSPGKLRVIGDARGDYNNLVFEKADRRALRAFFSWLSHRRGWRSLVVRRMPAESATSYKSDAVYEHTDARVRKLRCWLRWGSPLISIGPPTLHPRINAAKLRGMASLLAGYNYRRRIKSLERKGALRYERLTSASDCKTFLAALMDMHIAEFSARGLKSLFLEESNRSFYEFLIEELAQYQAVRLDRLTLDGRLIAGHFGFEWDGRLYHYKLCFDQQYSRDSPGLVLLGYMIEDAARRDVSEIDFLSPGGLYKEKYASDVRAKRALRVYRSPYVALLDRWHLM